MRDPTVLIGNKFGILPTPGSSKVLDRDTKTLVECDATRCRYGDTYDDIGWVNRAPYMGFGGWACSVNNYTSSAKKRLATEFCSFMSSYDAVLDAIVPYARGNASYNGQDPFRERLINDEGLKTYIARGYEAEQASEYLSAIRFGLGSSNVVTDIRFPTTGQINAVLDTEFYNYLYSIKNGTIPNDADRTALVQKITSQWNTIIKDYNSQSTTKVSVLEAYQRLTGVFVQQVNYNQLGGIRGYGYSLTGLLVVMVLISTIWTMANRKTQIVRASQPFFLVLICFGSIVLGSVIIPFGIDDSVATVAQCSAACMSIPWLIATGWAIVFSALFAKIWRVNIVYRNSLKFRRLKVSEWDVLVPFFVMFCLNCLILIIWTVLDPMVWLRYQQSDTESFGTCSVSTKATWKVCLSLLGIINGGALFMANFQAYQARNLQTEYSESKYIGMAMVMILQIIVVGLPLLFLVTQNPLANYFVRVTIVFVICFSILSLIFVPKIVFWWKSDGSKKSSNGLGRDSGLTFRVFEGKVRCYARFWLFFDRFEVSSHLSFVLLNPHVLCSHYRKVLWKSKLNSNFSVERLLRLAKL
jgi:hypothetical protein